MCRQVTKHMTELLYAGHHARDRVRWEGHHTCDRVTMGISPLQVTELSFVHLMYCKTTQFRWYKISRINNIGLFHGYYFCNRKNKHKKHYAYECKSI